MLLIVRGLDNDSGWVTKDTLMQLSKKFQLNTKENVPTTNGYNREYLRARRFTKLKINQRTFK
jgi:hypothetical protein